MRRFLFTGWLLLAVGLLGTGCQRETPAPTGTVPDSLAMHWQPIDSLNARLPDGVRAFSSESERLLLRAWYVLIDEPDPDIVTRVAVSDDTDRRETVSSFARDLDLDACVAVNGGYFRMDVNPAGHVGLLMTRDSLWEPATRSVTRSDQRFATTRAAIGFTAEDEIRIGWVSTRNGRLYHWPQPPDHAPGEPAALDWTLAKPWDVREALGAGPLLVTAGTTHVAAEDEVFFGTSIPDVHPRSAAGVTAEGGLLLMVVDGRQPESRGVNLRELATLMRGVGAVEALNLDGGGSSALVVDGVLLNRPQGSTTQREVMSALVTSCS